MLLGVSESGKKIYGDYVTEARQREAAERAGDLAAVISELRASGVTSLSGLAVALTERAIPRARGGIEWTAAQVSRVLARL